MGNHPQQIGGLFRRVVLPFLRTSTKGIVPFLKKEQKDANQKCVVNWNRSGDDVLEGESLKSSVKKRVPHGITRTAGDENWQTGSGYCKRQKTRRKRDALS